MIERIVLAFYLVNVIAMIGYLIYFTLNLDLGQQENIYEISISSSYYLIMFIIDVLTLFYFTAMARHYSQILKQLYKYKYKLFSFFGCFLITWIILTIFRFDIYYNIPQIVFFGYKNAED